MRLLGRSQEKRVPYAVGALAIVHRHDISHTIRHPALEALVLLEGGPTDEELAVIPVTEMEAARIGEVTLPVTENTTPIPIPPPPNFTLVYIVAEPCYVGTPAFDRISHTIRREAVNTNSP